MGYLDFLEAIAEEDVAALKEAERSYGDSWKKRGGVGAFMMLARKWDRIERQVEHVTQSYEAGCMVLVVPKYDILAHLVNDPRPEGLIDDIRDLRRYLILVEAELQARNASA